MRSRFVYRPGHPRASPNGFVNVEELGNDAPQDVAAVPIVSDRYMEGTQAQDGTDISSRTKRREYMKSKNLADADDFKGTWKAAQEEKVKIRTLQGVDHKERRENIARALYERSKP
jgi:hypothetical protein